jgi:hypothetical protein
MAGAGKKTFTAGETLTASDVNTYLMEQSVMVFGGTAARSSAIPTPSEGMFAVTTDDDELDYYNGSSWVSALPVGAWKAYTPTLTGLTVGNAVTTFSYAQVGKIVHVRGLCVLGTTSTMTGPLDVSLPFNSTGYTTVGTLPVGNASFHNGVSSYNYGFMVSLGSATSFRVQVTNAASTYAAGTDVSGGGAIPFAWTSPSGKFFACAFTYEAA